MSRRRRRIGMTLLEVLIALFIFMVGIVGVLAAMPTGINSAQWVIFQDAAIHLAHSKFSEFRRDRLDSSVFVTLGAYQDFPHAAGEPYEHFDDIERYEWKVEVIPVKADDYATAMPAGTDPIAGNHSAPSYSTGVNLDLVQVVVVIHMKGTSRELRFTQFFTSYGPL